MTLNPVSHFHQGLKESHLIIRLLSLFIVLWNTNTRISLVKCDLIQASRIFTQNKCNIQLPRNPPLKQLILLVFSQMFI